MGNIFGKFLTITTFGESHGPGVGVVVDGCPPGIKLDVADVQYELDRRRPGQSAVTTQRREPDRVEILSGIFQGMTTGMPIAMLVRSEDARPEDYDELKHIFRPGHADYTYWYKYGIRDYRGSGRASGRETVGRVAAGVVARLILQREGCIVQGFTVQVGDVVAKDWDNRASENSVRCPDGAAAIEMERIILEAREAGDSLGGVVEVHAAGVPKGLGDPVMDKLDASLAWGLMSIGAVKGFEVGDGFASARLRGSEMNDAMHEDGGFLTNHAGGILGGISTGEVIVVRIAVKPPSSIRIRQKTVDIEGRPRDLEVHGRHDPCLCPRVVPVAEAMVCLTLADALIRQRAIQGWTPRTPPRPPLV